MEEPIMSMHAHAVRAFPVLIFTAALAAFGVPGGAAAETATDYPSRPITFINTSAAGSSLDLMMRTLGKFMSPLLKQNIIVEDRPGGTGAVGMGLALNKPADGYTIISATSSTSFLMADPQSRYKPDDFVFLRALQAEPSVVAVNKDSPYKTLPQLVNALKNTPDKVTVGGYAAAGFHQFVFFRLQQAARFHATWVPYQGGNEAALALMGQHIDAVLMTPSTALSQIRSGQFRLLGISTEKRDPSFPAVPTFKEQGYDVVELIWRGLMVKRGTPAPIIDKLSAALDKVEADPEWKVFMDANYQMPMQLTQTQMQQKVEREVADERVFLKSLGVAQSR
jgi:tripartite-type tricarboxylate transporter receptor subunit TctC